MCNLRASVAIYGICCCSHDLTVLHFIIYTHNAGISPVIIYTVNKIGLILFVME